MASCLRYTDDANIGAYYHDARWPQDSQDDWKGLPEGHRPYRRFLQLVSDLRQSDISIPKRGFHPDVEGMPRPHHESDHINNDGCCRHARQ